MSLRDGDALEDPGWLWVRLDPAAASSRASRAAEEEAPWAPRVDIHELDDALVLLLDLPGMKREEIDLQVDADGVTVQGRRRRAEATRDLRLERPAGAFRRAFRIGAPMNPAEARATYQDGVLAVTIPKARARQPRRVRVDVR